MGLLLFAPSSLHKGFLTVMRVWVQVQITLDSVCFLIPEGFHMGLLPEFLLLMRFREWVRCIQVGVVPFFSLRVLWCVVTVIPCV